MAIVVSKLQSIGPDRETAKLEFSPKSFLIRGPSETGKSYIRDCLWYLNIRTNAAGTSHLNLAKYSP